MFKGCTKLSEIYTDLTSLSTNLNNTNSDEWLSGVSSTGTLYCLDDSDVSTRNSTTIPAGWDNVYAYLYIENIDTNDGDVKLNDFEDHSTGQDKDVFLLYSTDNGVSWDDYDFTSAITIGQNEKVLFKAGKESDSTYMSNPYFSDFSGGHMFEFSLSNSASSTSYAVGGNIMSLLNQRRNVSDFATNPDYEGCFNGLFVGLDKITKADKLHLPAMELANSCYLAMFEGCSSLTTAPKLPATTLAPNCYQEMFSDCESLTAAPDLPATTLVSSCYNCMFARCFLISRVNVGFDYSKTYSDNELNYWMDYLSNVTIYEIDGTTVQGTIN